MDKIDDFFAVAAAPAPSTSEVGDPGWFSGLIAGAGVRATRVRYWWLNAVQGALLGLLDAAQIAHSKTDYSVVTRRDAHRTPAGHVHPVGTVDVPGWLLWR